MTFLLGSTLKVSLVVLAGLGVAAAPARRSAAARHWVLAASLLCALAMPALELVVPAWGTLVPLPASVARQYGARGVDRAHVPPDTSDAAPIEFAETVVVPSARGHEDRPVTSGHAGVDDRRGLSLFVLAVGLTRLTWLAARAPSG